MFSFMIVGAAAACGFALTPMMRELARMLNIVDRPDGRRKLHARPTPLGGGMAIFAAMALTAVVAMALLPEVRALMARESRFLWGLVAAGTAIVTVGLLDDRLQLRGRQKLLGQIMAAALLASSGLYVRRIVLFDFPIDLGVMAVPFTIFWIVGAINALNLIDGMDGLAGSVGVVLSLAIAVMAWMTGHAADALVALTLAGAIAGFLVYNLPPASVFLGDSGSMLIGLVLGALAIHSSIKGAATVALAAPTVIWAIPILDVSMAIIRRKLTGRSIYETDRGHLHHCLQRSGHSGPKTVLLIAALCTATCVGALIGVAQNSEWLALLTVLVVVAVLVVCRVFGTAEFLLMWTRAKSITRSMMKLPRQDETTPRLPERARLTGTRDWDDLWETVTVYAERFDLSLVQLNVNLPALNEEYHVHWHRRRGGPEHLEWTTEIPLLAGDVTVGRLRIRGQPSEGSVCSWIGELVSGLRPFEAQMVSLVVEQFEESTRLESPTVSLVASSEAAV